MVGIKYTRNGVTNQYYFQRNLQGDVTAIFDIYGTMVAKYLYDAWGNCTISSETTNRTVAVANPIRYRGYYYDDDTGLYYCNSRYYSPKWRRFISPDDTAYLDHESVNGLNLYCYCNNDPVNYADPSGRFAISLTILGLIVGAAIGATVGGIVAYNVAKDQGAEGWELFGWTMAGVVGGGIIGGALGAGIGVLATQVTGVLGFSITKNAILSIKGVTVLGNMPLYVAHAQATKSGYYYLVKSLLTGEKVSYHWENNLQYIKDAISLGSQFVLAPDEVVKAAGTLIKEIQYLIENVIPWIMC